MRDGRIAEWMLGLVVPAEQAAAIAGDLQEEAPMRGPVWFWMAVLRTTGAFLLRGVDWAVLSTAVWAGAVWLVYVVMTAMAIPVVTIFATFIFGILHVLTHEPIAQLAIRIPLLQFDWPRMSFVAQGVSVCVMILWGPYEVGQWVARVRPGRELLAGLVAAGIWFLLPAEPFHSMTHMLDAWTVPVMVACILAGAMSERRRFTPSSSTLS